MSEKQAKLQRKNNTLPEHRMIITVKGNHISITGMLPSLKGNFRLLYDVQVIIAETFCEAAAAGKLRKSNNAILPVKNNIVIPGVG